LLVRAYLRTSERSTWSLSGARREAQLKLSADTPKHEAKARLGEWQAEIETRIATLRAKKNGEGQPLTKLDVLALAGRWYTSFVGQPWRLPIGRFGAIMSYEHEVTRSRAKQVLPRARLLVTIPNASHVAAPATSAGRFRERKVGSVENGCEELQVMDDCVLRSV
jgi:hypothetical protein